MGSDLRKFMDSAYRDLEAFLGKAPFTVLFTNVAFILLLVLIWKLTSRMTSTGADVREAWINRLIALIGGLCGWAIGTAFAPYSTDDLAAFQHIGSVVSAFVSGYVVSKLDRFLEQMVFQGSPDRWQKLGLFVASFLLVAITVFINRFYAFSIPTVEFTRMLAPSSVMVDITHG